MKYIQYQDWILYYKETGERGEPLLLFHGYGQTHSNFNPLIAVLKEKYRCYSFDLFFHGKSMAPKNATLDKPVWDNIFREFISRENITEFSLGGFSLGGKYVLAILESYPSQISQILFMAPDGIKTNIWYSMATYPYPLRRIFRSTIRHPQRFYIIIRALRKLRILDKSLIRFVENQMKTPSQRRKVYDTWIGMRHLRFKTQDIRNNLIEHDIHTMIFVGKHDKIIPAKPFLKFSNTIPSCKTEILDCGHNELISSVATYYSSK